MDSHAVRPKTDWSTPDMGEGEWWLYQYTPPHELPLGVIVPKALDNVFVERLWRSVKYEDIYLWRYEGVPELQQGLGRYFPYYNEERLHQSLEYRTPAAVYRVGR